MHLGRRTVRRGLLLLALVAAAPGRSLGAVAAMDSLLERTSADSLGPPLRRLESRLDPAHGAEVAMTLGRYRFARGEYREAVAAFGRAAARLEPGRKPEARYWMGLSWLGLGDPSQARAALEDVAHTSAELHVPATLALAQAWELARRPERALELLSPLAEAPLGESGPALLERLAALDERFGATLPARRARARLLEEYPRSTEAAAARLALAALEQPGQGAVAVAVVIGSFVDASRARSLAGEARRAGFPHAEVIERGTPAPLRIVRLGVYANARQARAAGDQAARALGVSYEIERAR
jgi:tetratricopeptide (TPR) repeat protein